MHKVGKCKAVVGIRDSVCVSVRLKSVAVQQGTSVVLPLTFYGQSSSWQLSSCFKILDNAKSEF